MNIRVLSCLSVIAICGIFSSCYSSRESANAQYGIVFGNDNYVPAAEIVQDRQIIELDTIRDALIPNISDYQFARDRIYCFSNSNSGFICVFTLNGKFLFRIDNKGRAAHEWTRLASMFINEEENTIALLDGGSKKVLLYDLDGKYIKNVKLGEYDCNEVAYNKGYIYSATNTGNAGFKLTEDTKYKVNVYDTNGKLLSRIIDDGHNDGVIALDKLTHFYKKGSTLLYVPTLNNCVYVLDGQDSQSYAEYDCIGDDKFVSESSISELAEKGGYNFGDGDDTFYSNVYAESEQYVYRRLGYHKAIDVIYDKKNDKTYRTSFDSFCQNKGKLSENFLAPPPFQYYKGRFYSRPRLVVLGMSEKTLGGNLTDEIRLIRNKNQRGEVNNILISYKLSIDK